METESLVKQLKSLKGMEPDPVFLKWSCRAIVMSAQEPVPRQSFMRILQRIASFKLAVPVVAGVMAAIIALIAAPDTIPSPEPKGNPIIASLNPDAIKQEESVVAPEHKLTEAGYYKNVTPAITLALNDIIDPNTNWQSSEHLKHIAQNYGNTQ